MPTVTLFAMSDIGNGPGGSFTAWRWDPDAPDGVGGFGDYVPGGSRWSAIDDNVDTNDYIVGSGGSFDSIWSDMGLPDTWIKPGMCTVKLGVWGSGSGNSYFHALQETGDPENPHTFHGSCLMAGAYGYHESLGQRSLTQADLNAIFFRAIVFGGTQYTYGAFFEVTYQDIEAPTITSGPSEGQRISDSTPTFTQSRPYGTLQVQLDGGGWNASPDIYTTPALSDGPHTVQFRAIDANGFASAVTTRSFTVDTTGAVATITGGPTGGATITDNTPTWTFSANEAGSSFEVQIDSTYYGSNGQTATWTAPALSDGPHTFYVRARDDLGNVGAWASASFVIDTTGATAAIIGGPPAGGTTADNTPTFTVSAEAGATFQYAMDGGEWSAPTSTTTFTPSPLSDGGHTFSVRAIDSLGNVGPATSRSFSVDTTGAVPTITGGPTGPMNDNTPTFSFTAEAGATFEVQMDAGGWVAAASPWTQPTQLVPGPHTFWVRAVDSLGNVGAPVSRSFIVTAPPAMLL